jgi:hypothetical protein
MRQPAINKAQAKQQISQFVSYQAPIGGWNAIDALANMQPTEAVQLDNWYPRPNYCEIRGGSVATATGMTGNGKTLAVYNGITGLNKMFCATASGVYNVSSSGAVGASVAARTNGKHQHMMFGDGTNNYLIMVNGVDKPLYYDGTTWLAVDGATSPALTGVTTTNLIGLCMFKGRLMFIEKGTLAFWYLAAGAAGGLLTKFDLSGVAQQGGYLMAAESWTVDAGNGVDDRMVFVTSNGEVIVYQGTNPSSSTTWGLVGIYHIGEPLGRQCILKIGAELIFLTKDGAYPISTIWQASGLDFSKAATRKVQNEFNDMARIYGANYGWKAISYPEQSAVLVNIPLAEDGIHYQFVMNTLNNSWCRFIGWDAEDFALFNSELYFCKGTGVYKAWTGLSDLGSNISAYAKTAFSYFNTPGQQKDFKLFRPVIAASGTLSFLTGMDIDYSDNPLTASSTYAISSGGLWGTAVWGSSLWSTTTLTTVKKWATPNIYPGYAAAGKLKIDTKNLNVQWYSVDYAFEVGNGI